MLWLLGLVTIPATMFGAKRFFLAQAVALLIAVVVLAVWLATPIAMWQAFGMGWVLAWLLPTTVIIFASVASKDSIEGG